jgi:adenosylcobinamide-phosphate synthase
VAHELINLVAPNPMLLAVGVVADLALGDPVYRWHPIRLMGRALSWFEARLRALGFDGYGGGIVLFLLLATTSLAVLSIFVWAASRASAVALWIVHAFVVYSLLALGDLLHHVWRIEKAARSGNLAEARTAVSALVGRDTDRMDVGGCRRAAVESLSESLTDGFISPVFWYVLGGLPGLVVFKVVSTMDSMVGYKNERYLRFGWCGARLDDVMNYVPARLTWLVLVVMAAVLPGYSGRKAWTVGLRQHALLLGPNAGWSEAATAGAIQRRLVGPIWLNGVLVTDLWIGAASDEPVADARDVVRAMVLITLVGVTASAAACLVLLAAR